MVPLLESVHLGSTSNLNEAKESGEPLCTVQLQVLELSNCKKDNTLNRKEENTPKWLLRLTMWLSFLSFLCGLSAVPFVDWIRVEYTAPVLIVDQYYSFKFGISKWMMCFPGFLTDNYELQSICETVSLSCDLDSDILGNPSLSNTNCDKLVAFSFIVSILLGIGLSLSVIGAANTYHGFCRLTIVPAFFCNMFCVLFYWFVVYGEVKTFAVSIPMSDETDVEITIGYSFIACILSTVFSFMALISSNIKTHLR